MELEYLEIRKTVRHGYQVLLRVEGELALPTDAPKIRSFYEDLSATCLTWAQEQYGEKLKSEYSALESTKERARFRTQKYRFRIRRCFEDERLASFLCESAFAEPWSGNVEGYHRLSHVWNKEEETLLPPSQILKAFGFRLEKRMLPFSPDGIYPEGEDLVIFRNATDHLSFAEKRFALKKMV